MLTRVRAALLFAAAGLAGTPGAGFGHIAGARASSIEALPPPSGPVILEVSGAIQVSNTPEANPRKVVRFDRKALERLPQRTVETYTDWTTGLQSFTGVPLAELLEHVGAEGEEIHAVALNDYAITIPVSDAYEYPVLLALKHNGEYMRIRDKGPLWIIYPSDEPSADSLGPHNHKMIWQLASLEIRRTEP